MRKLDLDKRQCDMCLQYVDADELRDVHCRPASVSGYAHRTAVCKVCQDLYLDRPAFTGEPLELADIGRALSIMLREMREKA